MEGILNQYRVKFHVKGDNSYQETTFGYTLQEALQNFISGFVDISRVDIKSIEFVKIHMLKENNSTTTDKIIAYEAGELNTRQEIELMAELIKTGQAFKLQGSYGRAATGLIESGVVSDTGEINEEAYDKHVLSFA